MLKPGAPAGTRRELPVYDGNVERGVTETGEVSARYENGPFGEEITRRGVGAQPYRFSTKSHDEETGLLYYGYDAPCWGRWLSKDPIGKRGGVNLYGFGGNDGVNKWDLLGQMDPRTEGHIAKFHPKLIPLARKHIESVNTELPIETKARREKCIYIAKITQSHRTYAGQDALYRKGRDGSAGPKVTNARGGQSNHN